MFLSAVLAICSDMVFQDFKKQLLPRTYNRMIKRLFFQASSLQRRGRKGARGVPRRLLDYALAAGVLAALVAGAAMLNRLDPVPPTAQPTGRPTVTDGDSLAFGAQRIRLFGIDAPEFRQTCGKDNAEYACGRQSRAALVKAIAGNQVFCEGRQLDRYGRLLAVCRAGGVELNRMQVERGWAIAYGAYEAEERQARAAGAGLWAGDFERPQDWRQREAGGRESDAHNRVADILARIGDWLRESLRFRQQQTYSPD